MYIKDTIKYKERQDLSELNETIEHVWIECQGKNKYKDYLVGVFYQTRPEHKKKTNMDSKATYDTFRHNNNLALNHRNCWRYQY